MFTKISVLVPTRKRVERLRKMMASFEATACGCSEMLFRIDEDDEESKAFFAVTPGPVVIGPRLEGYRSTPQFLLDMIKHAEGDVLMVGNDDMVFETKNWDAAILKAANHFPDGLFNIGVTTLNTDHYPFSIISKQVVEVLGFMYDPRLFWGDIFLRDVMAAFDRCILLPEVKITHDWAGFNPDVTFAEADGFKTTVGTAEYWQRHAVYVQEAVERLRGVTA
jgi:hypothetical protein